MTTAADLKSFRNRHRISQEDLGILLGRSRGTINAYENGGNIDKSVGYLLDNLVRASSSLVREQIDAKRISAHDDIATWINDDPFGPEKPIRREFGVSRIAEFAGLVGEQRLMNLANGYAPARPIADPGSPLALESRLTRLGTNYETFPPNARYAAAVAFSSFPEAQWLAEDDVVTVSVPQLKLAGDSLKTVGTAVSLTRRLRLSTAQRAPALVMRLMLQALTRALDNAAVVGGSENLLTPLGVLHMPGVNEIDATAENLTEPDAFAAAQKLLETLGVNSFNLGVIANPTTKHHLACVQNVMASTQNPQPLWRVTQQGDTCGGMRALVVPDMPDKTLLVGDFSTLTIRHSEQMIIRQKEDVSDTITLYGFLDSIVESLFPQAFVKISNVWQEA